VSTATLSTREVAQRRLADIRNALALADDLLHQAFVQCDWKALGHSNWEAYCAAELPELRMLRLSNLAQTEKFATLHREGLSTHAIAAAYGVSQGTVRNRLKGTEKPATVMSRDGRVRPATVERSDPSPAPVQKPSGAAQVRAALVKAGAGGVTTPELVSRLRLHWGVVSGELSRLAKTGRALLPTVTRDGYAVYIDANVLRS
jgi:transposase